MTSPDTSPPETTSPSHDSSQRLAAVRMPIEEPVENFEDAVQKLRQCNSTELRRARQHHRRALESLQDGGYSALSEATREHLTGRLRTNLKALNHVLDTPSTASSEDTASSTNSDSEHADSFSSRFRAFFQSLW